MRQGTVIAIKTSLLGKLVGFRVKGAKQFGGKVVDVPVGQMLEVLNKVPDAIDNLTLNSSKEYGIEFINGSQSRTIKICRLTT